MFDLSVNRSRPTQDHYLNNLGRTLVRNATYRIEGNQPTGSREDLSSFCTINKLCGHVGRVPELFVQTYLPSAQGSSI